MTLKLQYHCHKITPECPRTLHRRQLCPARLATNHAPFIFLVQLLLYPTWCLLHCDPILPLVLANHTFMAHAHTPCLAFCMVWWDVLWHMLTGSSHLRLLLCTFAQLLYPILGLLAATCRCAKRSLLFHMLPPQFF
jgi:hypothetical protein